MGGPPMLTRLPPACQLWAPTAERRRQRTSTTWQQKYVIELTHIIYICRLLA